MSTATIELFDNNDISLGLFGDIASAVAVANGGANVDYTIQIGAGVADVGAAQVVIDRNISIVGDDMTTTTIQATASTGASGDPRGMFLVNSTRAFDLSDLEVDGSGFQIFQAIRYKAGSSGDIDSVHF